MNKAKSVTDSSVLIEKMKKIQNALLYISNKYINIDLSLIDEKTNEALAVIGASIDMDRAYILEYDYTKNTIENTYEWCNEGISSQIENLHNVPLDMISDSILMETETYIIEDVEQMQDEYTRLLLLQQEIKSIVTSPLFIDDQLFGYIGFDSVNTLHTFTDDEISLLETFASLYSSIINRRNLAIEKAQIEEKYKQLFELSADCILVLDPNTHCVLDGNENAMKMFGSTDKSQIMGMRPYDFCPEKQPDGTLSKDAAIKHIDMAIAKGSHTFEFHHKKISGELFIASINLGKIAYKDSFVLQGTIQDITVQKRDHANLIKGNEELGQILENTPIGILISVDGYVTMINATCTKITGLVEGDATQCLFTSADYSKYSSLVMDDLRKNNGVFNRSMHLTNTSGVYVDILLSAIPWDVNGESGLLCWVIDMTPILLAQDQICESEMMLNQATINANIGLWSWDVSANEIQINDIITSHLGYSQIDICQTDEQWSTLIGGLDAWLSFVHPDDTCIASTELDNYIHGVTDTYKSEFRIRCKDGSYKWILSHGREVGTDADGNISRMIGVHIDINDIKNTQRQLEEAKQIAEMASRVKSEFLANMSHEIRTPMNAVIGLNSLLYDTDLTTKQQDYVDKIGSSAKNLLAIINDILDFSKLESGKLSIEKSDFSLEKVLQDLSTIVSFKALEKDIELLIDKDIYIPDALSGDPLRLGQALLNLTSNAIKFTEYGEVVVRIQLLNISDKITLKFSVTDTGIGITSEQKQKLFQAFEQADTTTTRKYGGTGLGLIITKNIINLMGGQINIDSEYGQGSTFYFVLDFDRASKILPNQSTSIDSIKNIRVLIADDSNTACTILSAYLDGLSISPTVVSSGTDAIVELQEHIYDIVILDWKMPAIDGFDTWQRIKNSPGFDSSTKAILTTAYSYDDMTHRALSHGFSAILPKPFSQSVLYETISNAYSSHPITPNREYDFTCPIDFDDIRGAKILLVEDNMINQLVTREMLEVEGFFVDVANNGSDAFSRVKKYTYDIILMDLQMPIMDGYETAHRIRIETQTMTPLVAISADVLGTVRDRALEAGMDDYLSKPVDKYDLFQILTKWIRPGIRELYTQREE